MSTFGPCTVVWRMFTKGVSVHPSICLSVTHVCCAQMRTAVNVNTSLSPILFLHNGLLGWAVVTTLYPKFTPKLTHPLYAFVDAEWVFLSDDNRKRSHGTHIYL